MVVSWRRGSCVVVMSWRRGCHMVVVPRGRCAVVPMGRRRIVVAERMVRARPVVVPAVIVDVNQVRVPFKTAGSPTPGIVIGSQPDSVAVTQSRVSVGISVENDVRVVYRNVNVFFLNRFDDNRLFFDDFYMFVTL